MKTKMIVAIRVCLTLLCCALPGFAQQPGAAKPTRGGPTPQPVLDGTAKLSEHYHPDQMLRLVIGLQSPHPDAQKKFLQELQAKDSPNFQHFLKPEEWNARFAPSKKAEQSVVDWAKGRARRKTPRYPTPWRAEGGPPGAPLERALTSPSTATSSAPNL